MVNSRVVLHGYEKADKLPSPPAAQYQTTSVTQPLTDSTSIAQKTGPSHLPLMLEMTVDDYGQNHVTLTF